jgi:hypothetical protein
MISHLRTAGCGLAAVGLVAAVLAPAPAHAAGATATLTVRARVIEGCETRLPDLVPPQARRPLPEHVRDLVVHDCRRPVEPQIDARWSAWPPARHGRTSVHRDRRGILVTISY